MDTPRKPEPSLNRVMLIGRVGRDSEMRYTQSGAAVTNFSLATNYVRRDPTSGDQVPETDWHNIVTWEKLAEICGQFVTKGRRVYVEGRLRIRSWEGQDGQKHQRTEIVANQVILLDSNRQREGEVAPGGATAVGGGFSDAPRPAPASPSRSSGSPFEEPPVDDTDPDGVPF